MAERLHLAPRHRALLTGLLRGPELGAIPFERLEGFREAVRQSTIPFPIEAHDWSRLPERFHRRIEREYVVLVEKGCAVG